MKNYAITGRAKTLVYTSLKDWRNTFPKNNSSAYLRSSFPFPVSRASKKFSAVKNAAANTDRENYKAN
jgi:hypothetical protein